MARTIGRPLVFPASLWSVRVDVRSHVSTALPLLSTDPIIDEPGALEELAQTSSRCATLSFLYPHRYDLTPRRTVWTVHPEHTHILFSTL